MKNFIADNWVAIIGVLLAIVVGIAVALIVMDRRDKKLIAEYKASLKATKAEQNPVEHAEPVVEEAEDEKAEDEEEKAEVEKSVKKATTKKAEAKTEAPAKKAATTKKTPAKSTAKKTTGTKTTKKSK